MTNTVDDLDLPSRAAGALAAAVVLRGGDPLSFDPVLVHQGPEGATRVRAGALGWVDRIGVAPGDTPLRDSVEDALRASDPVRFATHDPGIWVDHVIHFLVNMLVFVAWSDRLDDPTSDLGVGIAVAVLRVEVLWGLLEQAPSAGSDMTEWIAQIEQSIRLGSPVGPTAGALHRAATPDAWANAIIRSGLTERLTEALFRLTSSPSAADLSGR